MQREHEEAMRADFAAQLELDKQARRPGATATEVEDLRQRRAEIEHRWSSGPHVGEWEYLSGACHDWCVAPEDMRQFLDTVEHNHALRVGPQVLTHVQRRSQQQARQLTGNDRPRHGIERSR